MASSSTNLNMGITNDERSLGNDLKRINNMHAEPTRLYEGKRKNSEKKFSHLQQLKAVMPKE